MRVTLAASLLTLLPAALAAQPASVQAKPGQVYLSLMGEPFVAPAGQSPLGLWLAKADIDRSGTVSVAELTIDAERFFKTLDVDGDGRIGGIEMTRYEEQVAPASLRVLAGARPVGYRQARDLSLNSDPGRTAESRGRGGDRGGGLGSSMATRRDDSSSSSNDLSSIPQPVAMTDVDMSGQVTVEEFARAATRRFAMHDANKNGLLDVGELSGRAR